MNSFNNTCSEMKQFIYLSHALDSCCNCNSFWADKIVLSMIPLKRLVSYKVMTLCALSELEVLWLCISAIEDTYILRENQLSLRINLKIFKTDRVHGASQITWNKKPFHIFLQNFRITFFLIFLKSTQLIVFVRPLCSLRWRKWMFDRICDSPL